MSGIYPTSNIYAQVTHAAWDAAYGYDFEDDERGNPAAEIRIAIERQRLEQKCEVENENQI